MKINTKQLPNRHEELLTVDDARPRIAFCRCWKSKRFPYCDGSHRQHNNETGDNLGPVVVIRKDNAS